MLTRMSKHHLVIKLAVLGFLILPGTSLAKPAVEKTGAKNDAQAPTTNSPKTTGGKSKIDKEKLKLKHALGGGCMKCGMG